MPVEYQKEEIDDHQMALLKYSKTAYSKDAPAVRNKNVPQSNSENIYISKYVTMLFCLKLSVCAREHCHHEDKPIST